MSTSESLRPARREPAQSGRLRGVGGRVASAVGTPDSTAAPSDDGSRPRRRLLGASAIAAVAAAGAVAVLAFGSPGGGPEVEDARAAVEQAARVTATSAERSGTVIVRITHDGEFAGKSVRWNGADVAIAEEPRPHGREMRMVSGTLYGQDVDGSWLEGSPSSIDPDSGTTPRVPGSRSRGRRRRDPAPVHARHGRPYDHSARRRLEHLPRHRAGRGDRQGDRLQGRTAHPRAAVGRCPRRGGEPASAARHGSDGRPGRCRA